MTGPDDFIVAIVTNAIVAWVDSLDTRADAELMRQAVEIKDRLSKLNKPLDRLERLPADQLRDQHSPHPQERKLTDALIADPLIAKSLTGWLLTPDPDEYVRLRESAIASLAHQTECDVGFLSRFVADIEIRLNHDLGLSNMRQHREHRLMLQLLVESKNWQNQTTQQLIDIRGRLDQLAMSPPPISCKPRQLPYLSLASLFKGRDAFLVDLRASLIQNPPASATAVTGRAVHGLGGVGKTRLAVEYAWRYADDYAALLFAVADSPENLRKNLAAFVEPDVLNLPQRETNDENDRFRAVLDWLAAHPGWLLILDNPDDEPSAAAVESLLPQLQAGHVLITTRFNRWSPAIAARELDTLSLDAAVDFLLERSQPRRKPAPTDAADARTLAGELDGLALALELAGAYVAAKRISFADYLALWRAHNADIQNWPNQRESKYPTSLAVTWQTTMDKLGSAELALLRILCWYAPDPFPLFAFDGDKAAQLWILAHNLARAEKPSAQSASTEVDDAVNTLADYSMIRFDTQGRTVTMHRVVQEILRTQFSEEAREAWLLTAMQLLHQTCPREADDVRTWAKWNLLHTHVATSARFGDETKIVHPTGSLMNHLGNHLRAKASYHEAESWLRRSVDIAGKVFGESHETFAIGLSNLAMLLRETNRLSEAEPLFRRALKIIESALGLSHPYVATALNSLAQLLQASNRLPEAEELFRRALLIDESVDPSDLTKTARDLNNLAQLLKDMNRFAEAEPLLRKAIDITERVDGATHPHVATAASGLGALLWQTKRPGEAEPLLRRALSIDEHWYGTDHPIVARDLSNLGQLLKDVHRFTEAEPLLRRALDIDERKYGPNHPNVAIRLNNLAILLAATNRLKDAEPLSRRQVEIFRDFTRATGHQHPHLQAALKNYAGVLTALNLPEPEIRARVSDLTP